MFCQSCKDQMYNKDDMLRLIGILLAEHGSAKKMAYDLHMSQSTLSEIRHGDRALPPRVVEYMGYEKRVIYVKKDEV
jgi:AraC-like DNA-binding protein